MSYILIGALSDPAKIQFSVYEVESAGEFKQPNHSAKVRVKIMSLAYSWQMLSELENRPFEEGRIISVLKTEIHPTLREAAIKGFVVIFRLIMEETNKNASQIQYCRERIAKLNIYQAELEQLEEAILSEKTRFDNEVE